MTGELLRELAARHELAAVYMRAPDEPPIDPALAATASVAVEVARPAVRGPGRVRRSTRRTWGLLAGRPTWPTDWRVGSFARRVRELERTWKPDLVQAELHVMAQYLSVLRDGGTPTVVVEHDPGAATATELAAWERGPRRAARRLDALAWRRYERRVLERATAVVTFTERDRESLAAVAPTARTVRISPGVAIPPAPSDPVGGAPPRALFVGSFGHAPNVEAATRLVRDIFPAVRARVPEAVLEIVGAAPPPALRRLAGDGIELTDRVPDVGPHLDRAAVVVAPLRLGGGMRVKVLDALAAGKAVVATPRALSGLDLVPERQVAVAEHDRDLAEALATLLADPDRRARLGGAAREWALEHLRWGRAVAGFEELYASILRDADRGRP